MVAKFLIGAVLLATAAPAYAAEQEFVLVNKTGKTVKTIELSDTGKAAWVAERLEEGRVNDPVRAGAHGRPVRIVSGPWQDRGRG